ncbi:AraC family transcriptional regulator [Paenibacillus sp. LHD-117]|uniref:AraC family transcriptional regulator n=1 Tax=Paenibacillus sp. LHD-117 TaxID=3071412 RepID=UPI0027E1C000|nr:AraC family transcriptional regulator [Paenibacillus sp. LHD-117]MDQ6419529.1 AraC family transcriptional regulator [Paenibacillus sp. LHD-117]
MHWKDDMHERVEFLYHTPSPYELGEKVWVVRGGQSITKPSYHVGPKRMDCYSLHAVTEGKLVLRDGSREFGLSGGDLFCKYKGRSYIYHRDAGCKSLTLCWLAFDGPGAETLLLEAGFTPEDPFVRGRFGASLQTSLTELFQLIRGTQSSENLRHSLDMQSALLRFFACLMEPKPDYSRSPSMEWVRQSVRYIELHAAEGLSVEQLAALAGISRTYFSTAFAEQVGISPLRYIARVRMDKAAKLLGESTASIAEIAYSLGYANPFAFTRAFAAHNGMPPSEYRRRLRQQM